MSIKRILTRVAATLAGGAFIAAAPVGAAPGAGYSLFGEADLVSPGNNSPTAVQMVSDNDPGWGGVDFEAPDGMTFDELTTLSTDYNVTDDDCGGGSPRFQVNLDTDGDDTADGNAFVYIGPAPNYTNCPTGWQSTGNLADDTDFIDTSQLGGAFYDTWANARTTHGDDAVVGIQLVTDSGWFFAQGDGEQTVQADNVMINDKLTTFETKDSCKKYGWMDFTSEPGPFKNQGQCVSYFARQQND